MVRRATRYARSGAVSIAYQVVGDAPAGLHRAGDTWIDVGHARYLAAHIPPARYVELPGSDHRPWLGDVDAIADEVEVFVTGRKSRPRRRTSIGVDALSRHPSRDTSQARSPRGVSAPC